MATHTLMSVQRPGASRDPFESIQAATDRHRAAHGCWAYPHADGRVLGVLAAATRASRILELGTALGYTALWLAHGAPSAHVDTLERDEQHVALARAAIAQAGYDSRVRVWHGDFAALLPVLQPGYDLAFFDGHAPTLADLVAVHRLLRPGGLLVSANQQLAGAEVARYRAQLLDADRWLTAPLGQGSDIALSVRLDPLARHETHRV